MIVQGRVFSIAGTNLLCLAETAGYFQVKNLANTGACIILAILKNRVLISTFGSGYIQTVLKLTSIYGS